MSQQQDQQSQQDAQHTQDARQGEQGEQGGQDARQDFRQENRQAIVEYLRGGCKGAAMGAVGMEQEHFLLDEDGERVPFTEKHGRLGVKDVLEALSEFYPDITRTPDGQIVGCARPAAAITIEPAAQIEVSIAPLANVAEIEQEYRNFLFRLEQIVRPAGYSIATFGYTPVPGQTAGELELIPKERYRLMDAYFSRLPGMHAERMMRGSCSLQVSIDFADEADAVRKLRLASLLAPVFASIADNAPVFEGRPNTAHISHLSLWREVDPARCGVIGGLFDEDFGFGRYADWLLATPPIFTTHGGVVRDTGDIPAAEAYAGVQMDTADVEHLLSMFWPDARLKRYVEIRPADALPAGPAMGYVALLKGLFYGQFNLDLLEDALGVGADGVYPFEAGDVEEAVAAVAADGDGARIYGRGLVEWIDYLFSLAAQGLSTELGYLDELRDFRGV